MIEIGYRYEIDIQCAYCNHKNKDVYYAPTCSCDTFTCKKCKKENFIDWFLDEFTAKKVEDVTYPEVVDGFLAATSVAWSDEDIKKMCAQRLKEIKNANKR